jgi:hypothetical protein
MRLKKKNELNKMILWWKGKKYGRLLMLKELDKENR